MNAVANCSKASEIDMLFSNAINLRASSNCSQSSNTCARFCSSSLAAIGRHITDALVFGLGPTGVTCAMRRF